MPEKSDEARYVEDLIRRGEAAYPDEQGKLPPGVTHELIKGEPGEPPKVKRRRFSLT